MTAPVLPAVSCEFCRQPLHPGPCAGWKAAKAAGRDHTTTHHDLVPERTRRRRERAAGVPGPGAHPEVKLAHARDRQARIDHARNRADVLAELEERIVINQARPDTAKAVFDQYTRMRGVQDDPDIRKVGAALATGDPATLDKALAAVAKKLGLERIGGPRGSSFQLVRFNRNEQRPLGKGVQPGQPVVLVRPGYAKTVDGERLVIVKAVVEEAEPDEIADAGHQLASMPGPGMHEFCLNPLHPGPCKGWKGALKVDAKEVAAAKVKLDRGVTMHGPDRSTWPARQREEAARLDKVIAAGGGGAPKPAPETARAAGRRVALRSMSDAGLAEKFAEISRQDKLDEPALRAVIAEMERREAPGRRRAPYAPTGADRAADDHLERNPSDLRGALAAGIERRKGEPLDKAVARAHDEWIGVSYLRAEQATRGHMLSPAGKAAGIDPVTLFAGPTARARKYASEELQRWWADNPRLNRTQFRAQVLGRSSDRKAARATRAGSNGRDFI